MGPRGPQTLVSVCKVKTFHIILRFSAIFILLLPRVCSGLSQRLRDIMVTVDGMYVCPFLGTALISNKVDLDRILINKRSWELGSQSILSVSKVA